MKDNNKLIADFMGWKPNEHHWCLNGDKDLQYDTSWDWLIPVVNKIEMECEGVPLQLLNCNLYSEIGEVYQAVVEFIKTYNDER